MLNIYDLTVTQKNIRNVEQLRDMVKIVKDGGFFTQNCLQKHPHRGDKTPCIEITQFEDGKNFIHDGHHRVVSILLGGRDFIDNTEYRIRKFKYEDYLLPNLITAWWTPFDPRTDVRLSDMTEFKTLIKELIDKEESTKIVLEKIEQNRHLYLESRDNINTPNDFIEYNRLKHI
jgi:hypothetical protein